MEVRLIVMNESNLVLKLLFTEYFVWLEFIGQGIVGTNNGVPGLLKSKHFNLFPNQLPALVKDILSASNQQQKQEPRLFFKKKRDDSDDSSSAAAEELALNKRDASSNLDDQKEEKSLLESEVTSRMKRNMDDIENEIRSRAAETEQDEVCLLLLDDC